MDHFSPPMTRAQKSIQTRQNIFHAAEKLLKQSSYEELSVRSICGAANVSIGSFYHFFKSKDDMLAEFLMQNRQSHEKEEENTEDLLEYIIKKYRQHVTDCMEMGLEFTASYYNPKNQSFNVHTRRPGDYPVDLYIPKLAQAQAKGFLNTSLSPYMIAEDIRAIVIGNVFIWCSSNGIFDLMGNLERMLRNYLEPIFTESYYVRYPKEKKYAERAITPDL